MSETSTVTPTNAQAPAAAPEPPASPTPPSSNLPTVATPQAPAQRPQVAFDADDPISLYMNSGIFDQLQRVARMMAKANLVPAHLRGGDDKIADCFLVAAQAFRWRMDPFSVAQHTFVTQGKLGYEGKLIAALINASGRLVGNLKPVYSGAERTPERSVTIVGQIKGEKEERTISGKVAEWKTQNEKWTSMPDQMLFYRGAREWARRHMPEVMLGISAEEEIGETVNLERGTDGAYGAPAPTTLGALTEKLQAEAAAPAPAPPAAPEAPAPPATVSAAPATPEREPGSDDDVPTPEEAVKALAGAAATQQGSGPRRSEPTRVGAVGRQKRLEE